ncbi:MAG: OsmC family protein [Dysgonamonadaceae bacterium]|nr:OsmC family protein [Dysgonamonadaceae bacterium]
MKQFSNTCSLLLLLTVIASCNRSGDGAQPTLPDFQKRRLTAIQTLEKTPSDQIQPVRLEVRTTAEQRAGVRRIRIRGHQIISDSDYSFAGYSLGPGSPESSLTAIASDLADSYLSQAALKGVRIDSLGVSITSRRDSVPPAVRIVHPHNLFYTIYVKSPATDEELEEVRILAEQHSPAFNIASIKQVVTGDIDYGQTPKDLTFEPPCQPGLREYLKYKRAALLWRTTARQANKRRPDAVDLLAGHEQHPQLDRLHVEFDPASGARKVHIRHFNFIHDNLPLFAGGDLGPSSLEHQLGALTSCITHITEIQAASREIALDTLYITAEAIYDPRAGRPGFEDVPAWPHGIHYTAHYRSPHSYDEIVALRDAVEEVCPIYNLFISEQKIEGRIVRDDPDKYRIHPQFYYHYKD